MRLLDRTEVRARFAETLYGCDAPTPWTTADGEPGVIRDANHEQIAVVDIDTRFTDATAVRLATLICMAVNACAARAAETQGQEEAA